MKFTQTVGLILSLVFLVSAMPSRPVRSNKITRRFTTIKQALSEVANVQGLDLKNFLISNISSSIDPVKETWDLSTTFIFTDLNSNTSTSCAQDWTQTSAPNSGAPLGYVLCEAVNNGTESFQWRFLSYTSPKNFSIELAHEFSDPVHYPPPFNYVEYFANVTIGLTCEDPAGLECTSPDPVQGVITGISN